MVSDAFYVKVRKTEIGTYETTIPIKVIRFEGWKHGDELRIIAEKIKMKKET